MNPDGPLLEPATRNLHSRLVQETPPGFIRSPMPRPKVRPENRQRSCRACLACKASKIRCDGKDPCGSCLRRDLGNSCTYSGVDRRRKGKGKSGDVEPVAKAPSLPLGSFATTSASPDAPAILMENPISVAQVTPSLSPQENSLGCNSIDHEDVSCIDMGGKGVASSLCYRLTQANHNSFSEYGRDIFTIISSLLETYH